MWALWALVEAKPCHSGGAARSDSRVGSKIPRTAASDRCLSESPTPKVQYERAMGTLRVSNFQVEVQLIVHDDAEENRNAR